MLTADGTAKLLDFLAKLADDPARTGDFPSSVDSQENSDWAGAANREAHVSRLGRDVAVRAGTGAWGRGRRSGRPKTATQRVGGASVCGDQEHAYAHRGGDHARLHAAGDVAAVNPPPNVPISTCSVRCCISCAAARCRMSRGRGLSSKTAVLSTSAPSLVDRVPEIDRRFAAVIARCLDRELSSRLPSAAALQRRAGGGGRGDGSKGSATADALDAVRSWVLSGGLLAAGGFAVLSARSAIAHLR